MLFQLGCIGFPFMKGKLSITEDFGGLLFLMLGFLDCWRTGNLIVNIEALCDLSD